jgi:hypothetical protein
LVAAEQVKTVDNESFLGEKVGCDYVATIFRHKFKHSFNCSLVRKSVATDNGCKASWPEPTFNCSLVRKLVATGADYTRCYKSVKSSLIAILQFGFSEFRFKPEMLMA